MGYLHDIIKYVTLLFTLYTIDISQENHILQIAYVDFIEGFLLIPIDSLANVMVIVYYCCSIEGNLIYTLCYTGMVTIYNAAIYALWNEDECLND